jgi:chromosome segregation ATPase
VDKEAWGRERREAVVKTVFVVVTVSALCLGLAYTGYQWAFDGAAPDAKELVRRELEKLIDSYELLTAKCRKAIQEYEKGVKRIRQEHGKLQQHLLKLASREAEVKQRLAGAQDELLFIKGKIERKEPIRSVTGEILTPEAVAARVDVRGQQLAAAEECLGMIRKDREMFERMSEQARRNLNLAPTHRQTLLIQLETVEMKLRIYRERKKLLDEVTATDADLYTALYNEARAALGEASAALSGTLYTVDQGFQPLLREEAIASSETSSEAATQRALAQINALLGVK